MNRQSILYQPQCSQPQQLLTQQMPYATPLYTEPPQYTTSPKNPANHFNWSVSQQSQQSVSPIRTQDDPYSCNFIGQLAGSYKIDSPTGCDHVSLIVPEVSEIAQPYAIVRRVCDDGEALPDQFIYEEKLRFTMCTTDGNVVAMMPKGINMKHCVKWEKKDGSEVIWRRTGEVVFSLVSVGAFSNCSRRNSISSAYSTASSAIYSNSVDTQDINVHPPMRPELRYLCNNKPVFTPRKTCTLIEANPLNSIYTTEEMYQLEREKNYPSTRSSMPGLEKQYHDQNNLKTQEQEDKSDQVLFSNGLSSTAKEEELLEQIKAWCIMSPSLLEKVVTWGNSKPQSEQMNRQDTGDISAGRLWVTASTTQPSDELEEKLQEAVDDIKGAYQKVSDGLWQQPLPQKGEPGLQHRLQKDSLGLWIIEERIEGENDEVFWNVCAKELSDHRWVDMKNDRREIKVNKVQMFTILERMTQDRTIVESTDVQKNYVDFLFKSCNQKKLNRKLKKRNLKHNIANLKVKLDKQYALSFAVKVANTADVIAQELAARLRK